MRVLVAVVVLLALLGACESAGIRSRVAHTRSSGKTKQKIDKVKDAQDATFKPDSADAAAIQSGAPPQAVINNVKKEESAVAKQVAEAAKENPAQKALNDKVAYSHLPETDLPGVAGPTLYNQRQVDTLARLALKDTPKDIVIDNTGKLHKFDPFKCQGDCRAKARQLAELMESQGKGSGGVTKQEAEKAVAEKDMAEEKQANEAKKKAEAEEKQEMQSLAEDADPKTAVKDAIKAEENKDDKKAANGGTPAAKDSKGLVLNSGAADALSPDGQSKAEHEDVKAAMSKAAEALGDANKARAAAGKGDASAAAALEKKAELTNNEAKVDVNAAAKLAKDPVQKAEIQGIANEIQKVDKTTAKAEEQVIEKEEGKAAAAGGEEFKLDSPNACSDNSIDEAICTGLRGCVFKKSSKADIASCFFVGKRTPCQDKEAKDKVKCEAAKCVYWPSKADPSAPACFASPNKPTGK